MVTYQLFGKFLTIIKLVKRFMSNTVHFISYKENINISFSSSYSKNNFFYLHLTSRIPYYTKKAIFNNDGILYIYCSIVSITG